jgi:hypothetical protein
MEISSSPIVTGQVSSNVEGAVAEIAAAPFIFQKKGESYDNN